MKQLRVSRKVRLRQVLLARLRSIDQSFLTDAALKLLANQAARNLSGHGLGYGELNIVLANSRDIIATLAAVDRGPAKARRMTAAELNRLRQSGALARSPPWF